MFSTLKQRTIAVYHFLTTRRPHLGAFVFISILFLAGYVLAGIYAANTGHLSWLNPQMAIATGTADATAGNASSATDGVGILMGWVIKLLLAAASLMMRLAIFCLAFIIQIAGYNGYLSSTAVNVGWVMVRDITNMFFVVILLLVAFGTILGLEQYEWKKMLVKFFFAAVLVNFSRVICGVIIDVGQVIMITFVNGIAATAGGNLINAFSMDTIFSLSQAADPAAIVKTEELFTASLGALVFSSIILAMMLVFVFMLVSRMVVLWILIVLSPFAFVLSVIPQTQKYASQWWSEFGNHVVVGPAVVFFLWLSFAVVGGGQINTEVAGSSAVPETAKIGGQDSAGIGGIMDWNKMSNFAIAIGILLVGAKTSQSLGTVGGSAMSKATDFGKKVAMVASGASAAMWAGGKVKDAGMATGKWAAMNVPVVGGKAWVRKGKTIAAKAKGTWEDINQWRDKTAKGWDDSSKKLRALDRERRLGLVTEDEYKAKKEQMIAKGDITPGAAGAIGRFFKRQGMSMWESNVRSNKRVENWEKIAETKHKVTEAETSLSSEASGQLKTEMDVELELQEIKQKEKGATKRAEVGAARYRDENKAMMDAVEAAAPAQALIKAQLDSLKTEKTAEKELEKLKNDNAAPEKIKEAEDKLTKAREAAANAPAEISKIQEQYKDQLAAEKLAKGGTTIVGATAKVQAEKASSDRETAEGRLRHEILMGAEGAKLFNAKALAHEISEGLKDLETFKLTQAKAHEVEHDSKKWSDAVNAIKAPLDKLNKIKNADASSLSEEDRKIKNDNIDAKILLEQKAVRASLDKMARNAVHKNPSVFAAQSRAKYDHEYDLYRGKHKTAVDQAAQDVIWRDYGITTPTTAGHETIVDGFHSKIFKNMNYEQTMNAVDGFMRSMEEKLSAGGKADDTDRAISQAIYYQLHTGSWTDDAGQKISESKLTEAKNKAIGIIKPSEEEMRRIENAANKKRSGSSSQASLRPEQAKGIGEFLASYEKGIVTPDFVAQLRTGNDTAVKAFIDTHGKKLEEAIKNSPAMKGHSVHSLDDLFKMLKAEQDSIKPLIAELEKK